MRLLRRKPAVSEAREQKTSDLERQVEDMAARVERLRAVGTVVTVSARTGRARTP